MLSFAITVAGITNVEAYGYRMDCLIEGSTMGSELNSDQIGPGVIKFIKPDEVESVWVGVSYKNPSDNPREKRHFNVFCGAIEKNKSVTDLSVGEYIVKAGYFTGVVIVTEKTPEQTIVIEPPRNTGTFGINY